MSNTTNTALPQFFIQLFAEGGDGGTGAGAGGQNSAAFAQQQTGADTPDAGGQDIDARFKELIKGEFKEPYERHFRDALNRRLKGMEETVGKWNKAAPLFDALSQKYGVDAGDIDALLRAVDEDESYYEAEAMESGLTVQQVKEKRKMLRENAALKAELDDRRAQEDGQRILSGWMQQAEAVRQIYQDFDLQDELQNEQFRSLLQSGIPVQTAFEVIHKDELIPAAMHYTAKNISQKVANDIRAGSQRPTDGAMRSQNPVTHKSDVSQLTDADIDDLIERARRGEHISF